jgi:hypothetical protein
MDPYLEAYWGDIHHALCTYSRDQLRLRLPPGLIARMDERTIIEDDLAIQRTVIPDVRVVEGPGPGAQPVGSAVATEPMIIRLPDEPITEGFIQVLDTRAGGQVVTVIEFTSPTNKTSRMGREKYRQKQKELLGSEVSLVEVDLIRSGPWILRVPEEWIPEKRRGLYHVCATRGWNVMEPEVYAMRLRDPLPQIRVPLRPTDTDVVLDLAAVMEQAYENGSYGYGIDYSQPPEPPLPEAEAKWAAEWLRSH